MPIYEYVCSSCGHEKEVLQRLNDKALKDCPACGQPDFIKKISAPGFRLKGGGWYETDFKTGSKKNIAGNPESGAKPANPTEKTSEKPSEKSKAPDVTSASSK